MRSVLDMCLNWRVLAVIALAAAGIFAFAPGYALAMLPLLLLALCPLSMLLMMRMGGHNHAHQPAQEPLDSPEALRERLAALREEERQLERRLAAASLDEAGPGDSIPARGTTVVS